MIGSHPSMVAMCNAIARVAPVDIPVLILGESGTGKELVAQSIHDLGDRAKGPFIAINCGAIPDTLLENELFGSMRGALARADGGTLFLDEVGDISPAFQVKLLRFLQDGIVMPLGSEQSQHVSVRVIAATHRDLNTLVTNGAFREDLYYRLAAYEIEVPPLRERRSDIPLLVEHFRLKVGAEMHRDSVPGPSRAVLDLLLSQQWPGNVRQLEQVIRRTVIDSGGLVDEEPMRKALQSIAPATDSRYDDRPSAVEPATLVPLEEAERRHILEVLRATAGNQTQAAFILGIERKTLARKMKRMSIQLERS